MSFVGICIFNPSISYTHISCAGAQGVGFYPRTYTPWTVCQSTTNTFTTTGNLESPVYVVYISLDWSQFRQKNSHRHAESIQTLYREALVGWLIQTHNIAYLLLNSTNHWATVPFLWLEFAVIHSENSPLTETFNHFLFDWLFEVP